MIFVLIILDLVVVAVAKPYTIFIGVVALLILSMIACDLSECVFLEFLGGLSVAS
jgi:hypothetical protein